MTKDDLVKFKKLTDSSLMSFWDQVLEPALSTKADKADLEKLATKADLEKLATKEGFARGQRRYPAP